MPCQALGVRDFHKAEAEFRLPFASIPVNTKSETPRLARRLREVLLRVCTKSGHALVDGLHSIENTDSCGRVFLIDEKNRKRRTESFFDSFVSFSGWCGVRDSSGVTLLIERSGGRVSEGL